MEMEDLFCAIVRLEGSDLHLKVDMPPYVRVRGSLRPMNRGPIGDEEMTRLCSSILAERNRRIFEKNGGVEFTYSCECEGTRRLFRVAILRQLEHVGLIARPAEIV